MPRVLTNTIVLGVDLPSVIRLNVMAPRQKVQNNERRSPTKTPSLGIGRETACWDVVREGRVKEREGMG